MFFRQKKSGKRVYLQVVENRWEDGRSKQRVIATLGRLDQLQQTGQLEGLLRSGAKFCDAALREAIDAMHQQATEELARPKLRQPCRSTTRHSANFLPAPHPSPSSNPSLIPRAHPKDGLGELLHTAPSPVTV